MKFDLPTEKEAVSDFVTVSAGTYVCEVAEVRPGTTRGGDPRWAMRLVVAEGEHTGRHASWDGIVFSTRGRARAHQILRAMGLPNTGTVEIEPKDLEGRRAMVEVRPSEFENSAGETVRRNEVPYDGYRPLATDSAADGAAGGSRGGSDKPPYPNHGPVDPTEIPF